MIQVNRGEVQTAIRPIAYTHVTTPKPDARLAILLPGLGYSTDAPAFHYTAGLLLEQGYHIIEVNYRYRDPAYDQVELETQVVSDVTTVLDALLSSDSYDDVLVVGKSLGTIAMASLWENKAFDRMNGIWLTPLLNRADVKSAPFGFNTSSTRHPRGPGLGVRRDVDECVCDTSVDSSALSTRCRT